MGILVPPPPPCLYYNITYDTAYIDRQRMRLTHLMLQAFQDEEHAHIPISIPWKRSDKRIVYKDRVSSWSWLKKGVSWYVWERT